MHAGRVCGVICPRRLFALPLDRFEHDGSMIRGDKDHRRNARCQDFECGGYGGWRDALGVCIRAIHGGVLPVGSA